MNQPQTQPQVQPHIHSTTNTLMTTLEDREALARTVLAFADQLA